MKKNLVEINFEKLSKDDIVIYDGNKWIVVNKSVFLNSVLTQISELDKKIDREISNRSDEDRELQSQVTDLYDKVNYILGEEPEVEETNNEEEQ